MNKYENIPRRLDIRIVLIFIISFLYAFLLSSLDLSLFKDVKNYIVYINTLDYRKDLILSNGIIFYEPIFYGICSFFNIFFEPEKIVRGFIFFNSFTIFFFCLRAFRKNWLGMLLLVTCLFQVQVFAMELVTLRQGIALSLLLWIFPLLKKDSHLFILLCMLGMIHNSFFIIGIFQLAFNFLNKFNYQNYYIKFIYLFCFGLVFNVLIFVILSYFSTKQGQGYEDAELQGGGGGFLLWGIIFFYIAIFKKSVYQDQVFRRFYEFSLLGLIIYLSAYFLSPVAGRIIGVFVPFIYFSLLIKVKIEDIMFTNLILFINLYLFFNGGAEVFMESNLSNLFENIKNVILY